MTLQSLDFASLKGYWATVAWTDNVDNVDIGFVNGEQAL